MHGFNCLSIMFGRLLVLKCSVTWLDRNQNLPSTEFAWKSAACAIANNKGKYWFPFPTVCCTFWLCFESRDGIVWSTFHFVILPATRTLWRFSITVLINQHSSFTRSHDPTRRTTRFVIERTYAVETTVNQLVEPLLADPRWSMLVMLQFVNLFFVFLFISINCVATATVQQKNNIFVITSCRKCFGVKFFALTFFEWIAQICLLHLYWCSATFSAPVLDIVATRTFFDVIVPCPHDVAPVSARLVKFFPLHCTATTSENIFACSMSSTVSVPGTVRLK